jgi:uncharacterized membrane protein HdeD (DUF308 family)
MSHSETLPRPGLVDGGTPAQGPFGRIAQSATRYWWVLLVTGIAWVTVSVIIFRFDYTTVKAIGILFGVVALGAAVNEILVSVVSTPGWAIVHLLVAGLFAAAGIVSFFHPGNTFVALAALISFFLIFRGTLDLITGVSSSGYMRGWWLLMIIGIIELLVGFWAAGSWNLSVTVLIAWVGAVALTRGVAEIIGALELRELNRSARHSSL